MYLLEVKKPPKNYLNYFIETKRIIYSFACQSNSSDYLNIRDNFSTPIDDVKDKGLHALKMRSHIFHKIVIKNRMLL